MALIMLNSPLLGQSFFNCRLFGAFRSSILARYKSNAMDLLGEAVFEKMVLTVGIEVDLNLKLFS
jgi:hypothetical protein